jgi:hypothetical protein
MSMPINPGTFREMCLIEFGTDFDATDEAIHDAQHHATYGRHPGQWWKAVEILRSGASPRNEAS